MARYGHGLAELRGWLRPRLAATMAHSVEAPLTPAGVAILPGLLAGLPGLSALVRRAVRALVAALLLGVMVAASPAHAAPAGNSLDDPGPGDCATTCTLRTALVLAATDDTIQFGVTGTIQSNG